MKVVIKSYSFEKRKTSKPRIKKLCWKEKQCIQFT